MPASGTQEITPISSHRLSFFIKGQVMKLQNLILLSVTAYAQNLTLQDISISASTQNTKAEEHQSAYEMSEKQMEKLFITSTSNLKQFFPNLNIYPQGSDTFPMITIRGISGPDFYSFMLGLYIDGIPQSSNFLIQNLGDVASIRLINGSEGLFYGENAPLGLISITTKSPLESNYAKAQTSFSRLYETLQAQIGWNLLPEKLWFKANLSYTHDNGFIKDPSSSKMLNDGDSLLVGGSLYYQPISEVLLSGTYSYYHTLSHKDFFLSASQLKSLKLQSSEQITGYEDYTNGVQNKIFNKNPFYKLNAHNANLKVEYFAGEHTLSSITAFGKSDTLANSYPGIFVKDNNQDGYYYNNTQIIQELKLHSVYSNKIESLFGLYYKNFNLDNGMDNVPTGNPTSPPLYYHGTWRAIENTNTFALYGNVSIPFDSLTLHTGLRYQFYHTAIDVPLPPLRPAMPAYKDSDVFHSLNPRIALYYHLNPNHDLFIQISNSTKPGGFSKFPFADSDTKSYKSEQIYSAEFGNHSKFFDSALSLNTSLYYLFLHDTQAYVGEGYNKSIANIGNMHSVGIDMELSYHNEVISTFLNANLGYARFAKGGKNIGQLIINNTPSPYNVSGLAPRFSPAFSFTAGLDWKFFNLNNHHLTLSSALNFTSSYFLDDFNHKLKQPAYALLDLSLIYDFLNHYTLTLFTQNLTDTRYITSVLWDDKGEAYTVGNPFNLGIKLSYNY